MLGSKLTERLGQPVVVESVVQGIGVVGNQQVSRSAPDGHTLAMLTGGFTTQAAVMKTLPYDPVRDFAFISVLVAYPMLLLVAPGSPIASFQDFIARAKAAPGKVSYAIIGGGSVYHLLGKWIENRAGVDMVAVPYRGSVPAFTDVIGGRLDAMIDTATSAISRVRNGQVRALAISSPERYPLAGGHADHGGDPARHRADVVARAWWRRRRRRSADRDRLNEELRRALDAAGYQDSGWPKPACWRRRARRRNSGSGSRARSRSTAGSRTPTASRRNSRIE